MLKAQGNDQAGVMDFYKNKGLAKRFSKQDSNARLSEMDLSPLRSQT